MDPRGAEEASVDVVAWLNGLGLQQYEQHAIDDAVLLELTADELKDLGVSLAGHRRKLLAAFATLRSESGPEPRAEARGVADTSSAERRDLTVMFCDLVGSTALSTRYDPEDLRAIISTYHRCCTELVERNPDRRPLSAPEPHPSKAEGEDAPCPGGAGRGTGVWFRQILLRKLVIRALRTTGRRSGDELKSALSERAGSARWRYGMICLEQT
jgi:SAM domain (Sterile alpha motif)